MLRRKRRGGIVGETITVEMSERKFRNLIIADEAMRHIDINGLPSDEFEVIIHSDYSPDGHTFSASSQRPIYRPEQLRSLKIVHKRSGNTIWKGNFIRG